MIEKIAKHLNSHQKNTLVVPILEEQTSLIEHFEGCSEDQGLTQKLLECAHIETQEQAVEWLSLAESQYSNNAADIKESVPTFVLFGPLETDDNDPQLVCVCQSDRAVFLMIKPLLLKNFFVFLASRTSLIATFAPFPGYDEIPEIQKPVILPRALGHWGDDLRSQNPVTWLQAMLRSVRHPLLWFADFKKMTNVSSVWVSNFSVLFIIFFSSPPSATSYSTSTPWPSMEPSCRRPWPATSRRA